MTPWSDHADKYGLTRIEAKLFGALMSGETRSKEELRAIALDGRHSCGHLIPQHIYRLRPKLAAHGISIVAQGGGRTFKGWRLVMPVEA